MMTQFQILTELFLQEAGKKELNVTLQIHSCLCQNLMVNCAKFPLALPKAKICHCPWVNNELSELVYSSSTFHFWLSLFLLSIHPIHCCQGLLVHGQGPYCLHGLLWNPQAQVLIWWTFLALHASFLMISVRGLQSASHFLWPSETQFIWLDWLKTHALFLVCMNLISRITVIGRATVMWLFVWQVDTMCHYILLQLGKWKWWLYSFTTHHHGRYRSVTNWERERERGVGGRGRETTPLPVLHHPHCRQ